MLKRYKGKSDRVINEYPLNVMMFYSGRDSLLAYRKRLLLCQLLSIRKLNKILFFFFTFTDIVIVFMLHYFWSSLHIPSNVFFFLYLNLTQLLCNLQDRIKFVKSILYHFKNILSFVCFY